MSIKRAVAGGLAVLTLTGVGVGVGVAQPTGTAEAAPSSCWGGFSNNRNAYRQCSQGSGQHRAVAYCKNTGWLGGVTRFGPWRGVNQQSWVECPWGTVITQLYTAVRD